MKLLVNLILMTLISTYIFVSEVECKPRSKRTLIYPSTSLFGTFLAIAIPVVIPNKNVYVSYNFEANYGVPNNVTQYGEVDPLASNIVPSTASRNSRSITRELAYVVIQKKFKENGMKGRACLLRTICEVADAPVTDNGLMGHLMHILFTPSSSQDERLHSSLYEAEARGLRGDCGRYLAKCPNGFFDVISRLSH